MPAAIPLYKLTEQYREIEDEIIEAGGELSPELEGRLNKTEADLNRKVESCAFLIQEFKRASEAAKAEADRLTELSRVRSHAVDNLKKYVKTCMEVAKIDKIETDHVRARIQKNGRPSIAWPDLPEKAPERFQKHTITIDGEFAYQQWKENGKLPKGFDVNLGTHLRIS